MARPRKIVTFTDPQVSVPLDEKQQHVKARELAALCDEIDAARQAAKDDSSAARKNIRALEARRRELAECVRTGAEKQNAQVDLFKGPKTPGRSEAANNAAAEAFGAPEPSSTVDERDAFLATKPSNPFVSTWEQSDAAANRQLGELIETAHEQNELDRAHADTAPMRPIPAPPRPATTREPRAGGIEPSTDLTQSGKGSGGSPTQPRATSASDFGDPCEDQPAVETPPHTPTARRSRKNGKPDDQGPKAA